MDVNLSGTPSKVGDDEILIAEAKTIVGAWIPIDRFSALLLQIRYKFGSGDGEVDYFIQTSLDGGATPIDIAAFKFGKETKVKIVNLSATTPRAPFEPTNGELAPDSVVDGVIGGVIRSVARSTGKFSDGTTLSTSCIGR